jgi:hypothetical protein
MDVKHLGLSPGKWVIANCVRFPSEKNCKLVIMAPEDHRSDLVEAASTHAVRNHGHEDTSELRTEMNQILEAVEVS